ncbi:hypothetical protein [Burkholderia sola]
MIELLADDRPVDVEDESDVTELFAELRPVDSELMPVEVEVDSESSCWPTTGPSTWRTKATSPSC